MKLKITLILIAVTVIYAILGGVAFHYIEQGYEQDLYPQVLHEFSLYTVDSNPKNCLNWSDFVLLKGILDDMWNGGVYISQSGQLVNSSKWDVRSSIFASISILTAIGYHDLSPDFNGARIFCIFYGWIGIPLFYLANVAFSKLVSKGIQKVGKRLCGTALAAKWRFALVLIAYNVILLTLFVFIPAIIFSHLEKWSYAESLFFVFSSLFTIGFSSYIPGFNIDTMWSDDFMHWYRLATGFWVLLLTLLFVSQLLMLIHAVDDEADRIEDKIDEKIHEHQDMEDANDKSPADESIWRRGTSVTVGDPFGRTTGNGNPISEPNVYISAGTPEQLSPTNYTNYVNVVSVNQT